MKIDQLKELGETTTKEQLYDIINLPEEQINVFLEAQKSIQTIDTELTLEERNQFTEVFYKLKSHGYVNIDTRVMKIIKNENAYTLKRVYKILNLLEQCFDNTCPDYFDNDFIDNLIRCTIESKKDLSYLFKVYDSALDTEDMEDVVINLLSNKEFVLKYQNRLRVIMNHFLPILAKKEREADKNTTYPNVANFVSLLTSEELMESRTSEEIMMLIKFYICTYNYQNSECIARLMLSNGMINNRSNDEELYLLNHYNEYVLNSDNPNDTLKRVIEDEKMLTKVSFNFQVYLINILEEMLKSQEDDNELFSSLNKVLDQEVKEELDYELEIKKVLKDYSDYGITVKEIIDASDDFHESLRTIIEEAEREGINDVKGYTKLIITPDNSSDSEKYMIILKREINKLI